MYLRGYKIKTQDGQEIILPKWDFGGDKPYTNRIWNKRLDEIYSISEREYPLEISDLDRVDVKVRIIENKNSFEEWLKLGLNT